MLTELTEEVANSLDDGDTFVVEAVRNLAIAHKYGHHVLWGFMPVMKRVSESPVLDTSTQVICESVFRHAPTTKALRDRLKIRVEVIGPAKRYRRRFEGSTTIISVPVTYFAYDSLTSTFLLTESPVDAAILFMWARKYVEANLYNLHLTYEVSAGSGGTLSMVVEEAASRRGRMSICIVDSDRKAPSGALGSTAKKAELALSKHEDCLTEIHVLGAREIENLIPAALYRKAFAKSGMSTQASAKIASAIEHLYSLETTCRSHLMYWDVKKGLYLGDVRYTRLPPSEKEFWGAFCDSVLEHPLPAWQDCSMANRCRTPGSCSCQLIPPLGYQLLPQISEVFGLMNATELRDILQNDYRWPEWRKLGELLMAWLCATRGVRS